MTAIAPFQPPTTFRLPAQLAPSDPEHKNGRTWHRRLRKAAQESAPYWLQAIRDVLTLWPTLLRAPPPASPLCARCGRPWGHSDHDPMGDCSGPDDGRTWLEELVVEALARGPAMVWRELGAVDGLAADERLLGLMEAEGLDVSLASARLGIDPRVMEQRIKLDPLLAMRVEMAWLRATAAVVGVAHKRAKSGATRELLRVLPARDERYREKVVVEIGEKEIRKSPAWRRLCDVLLEAIAPGHECQACGGCRCRERLEAVRDG